MDRGKPPSEAQKAPADRADRHAHALESDVLHFRHLQTDTEKSVDVPFRQLGSDLLHLRLFSHELPQFLAPVGSVGRRTLDALVNETWNQKPWYRLPGQVSEPPGFASSYSRAHSWRTPKLTPIFCHHSWERDARIAASRLPAAPQAAGGPPPARPLKFHVTRPTDGSYIDSHRSVLISDSSAAVLGW